jgi:hypothetical protein
MFAVVAYPFVIIVFMSAFATFPTVGHSKLGYDVRCKGVNVAEMQFVFGS